MNADNTKTVYGIAEVIGKPDDTFGEVVEAVFVFVSSFNLCTFISSSHFFYIFFAVNHITANFIRHQNILIMCDKLLL